jgi:hypothetical protein
MQFSDLYANMTMYFYIFYSLTMTLLLKTIRFHVHAAFFIWNPTQVQVSVLSKSEISTELGFLFISLILNNYMY